MHTHANSPTHLELALEHLVRVVPDQSGDVVLLRRPHGRMDQHHGARAHVRRMQRAGEELIVRAVDRVAALEGDGVGEGRQRRAHLGGRRAGEGAVGA